MYRIARNIFTTLILILFIGCGPPPTIYMGSRIYGMNELGQLKQGISTAQDVRNVIGQPRGDGKVRHKPDLPLLDIWFYEFIVSKGNQVNVNIVIIFIDGNDTYQGHVAFVSDEIAEGI